MRLGPRRDEAMLIDTSSLQCLDIFEEVVVGGIYPLDEVRLPPALILDCGANIGCFASLCRIHWPKARIVCWEPNQENFTQLIAQPLLKDGGAECHASAVSNTTGLASFSGSGAGGKLGAATESHSGIREVPLADLPAWMRINATGPLLMKMDIEGHEEVLLPCLRGLWPEQTTLFLETHAPMGMDESTMTILYAEGFRIRLLRTHQVPGDPRIFKEYKCDREPFAMDKTRHWGP